MEKEDGTLSELYFAYLSQYHQTADEDDIPIEVCPPITRAELKMREAIVKSESERPTQELPHVRCERPTREVPNVSKFLNKFAEVD